MPATNPKSREDWEVLWNEVTEAFSPGAPVQERELFAGRFDQLRTLIDAVHQRGRHAVIFGERGVGKTSITNILSLVLRKPRKEVIAVKVNADPRDTFSTIWKKVFKRMNYEVARDGGGTTTRTIAEDYAGELTPDDVQLELANFSANQVPIIVLDEFDRVLAKEVTMLMADTIKALSDYSVNATIIIVGVAEDVTQLLQGHASISRSLIQVKMPRMTQDELAEIVQSRYKKSGIKADEESLWKITFLARGLPYYAHLLGMHSARVAISQLTTAVTADCIDKALEGAIAELDQSITDNYFAAIRSPRNEETLYAPVLLACALAKSDELGAFQQASVTEPLNRILPNKNYKPTTFAFHMNEFCEDARRKILQRFGEPRNQRYRFSDPVMQPYVILKGLADGKIDDVTAQIYANRRQLRLSTDW